MRTQVHNVNMQVGAGIPPIVKVSQYDELRVIGFRLFDGARAYFPGEDDVVTIVGTKPSGLGFTEECSVNGSVVSVETTLAMTQESGHINAELRISDGSTNIGTANFTLYVEPAPHPEGTTDGTTEEARTVLEQCAQYAQDAHEAASDVAPQVESLVDAAVADKMEEIEDAVQSVTDAATQAVNDIAAAGEAIEESIPADYTALSTQVSQLHESLGDVKADLGAVVATNLAANVTYSDGKSVYFDTGAEYSSSSYTVTDYIDITGIDKIYYNRIKSTSGTTKNGIAFYNSSKTYISGIVCARGSSEIGYVFSEADVPENAKYVRIPCLKTDKPTILYDKDDYDAKLVAKVDAIETEVSGFGSEINAINTHLTQVDENGYFKLDPSKWVLGGYSSYSSTNSRTYNVRYTDIIEFDRDVYIIAEAGFYVTYYLEGGGSDNVCVLKLPKNTKAKICMRRISQDTSETAVVSEWATKHKISTSLAPIELYAPTFTDVSMFERIGIGGDSYAAGVMSNRSRSWGKCLQRQSGVQVDVYAQSGISVGEWNTNTTNGLPALLAGEECGLYWLHHGINGTSSDAAIGTAADMETTPHPSTFYGQYAEAIEQIQSAFPNARIVLATITGSSYNNYQANGQYKKANTAIKAIAAHFEIPCIDIVEDDFFKLPWYSDYNYSNHPTAMQVAGMAMAYRRLLSKCIMDNPTYFKMYGIS